MRRPSVAADTVDFTAPAIQVGAVFLKRSLGALEDLEREGGGEGRLLQAVEATGGAAMPGIDCYMLAPGQSETRAYRSNANMVCLAATGEGVSLVGEETIAWKKNDIFTCPRGNWITHKATSGDAKLFQLTDRDVLAQIHYLREEFAD